MRAVVWLKDDLRLHDSPAVVAALAETDVADIAFVRTREAGCAQVRPTGRRIERENAAIADMRAILERSGTTLREIEPEAERLVEFCSDVGADRVFANAQTGDDLGHRRDRGVASRLAARGVRYDERPADGVARGSGAAPAPCVTSAGDLRGMRFAAVPQAIARLRAYLDRLPTCGYRRDMWLPGPDATASSRLSVDLACGALSGDRVLHEIGEAAGRADPRDGRAFRQFADRIHWRRGFVQSLERNVDAFAWGPVRPPRETDAERMRAWLAGETGYPLVDAAMRDLHANGWINFRLRQVVCSFAVDLLDLDMHEVGVALGSLFDDYCPGIHWCQMALQSGMVRGRGPRVINPVKQARELDPTGSYVRRVLPYMVKVPPAFVHEPWRLDGSHAPKRSVEHMEAARAARARHPVTTTG